MTTTDSVSPEPPKVEFGDLPPDTRVVRDWGEVTAQLRERPGQWAKIATKPTTATANSLCGNIRRGMLKSFPVGQFEAALRGTDVWARYVGGAS